MLKEVPEIENQVLYKRPSTQESLVRQVAVGRTCCVEALVHLIVSEWGTHEDREGDD